MTIMAIMIVIISVIVMIRRIEMTMLCIHSSPTQVPASTPRASAHHPRPVRDELSRETDELPTTNQNLRNRWRYGERRPHGRGGAQAADRLRHPVHVSAPHGVGVVADAREEQRVVRAGGLGSADQL